MKSKSLFYISILLLGVHSQFLRFLHPQKAPKDHFNYSSYSSISTNENLESKTLSSKEPNQSVVYITKSGIVIKDSNLNKESRNTTKPRHKEISGLNSAVLVNGGNLTITGGKITTAVKDSDALVSTNKGSVKITDTEITSTGIKSSKGLSTSFKGKIEANNVKISTQGNSSAALSIEREGNIIATGCSLSTSGFESPLIKSKGNVTLIKTEGNAKESQAIEIKGKSSVT